jgi:hypothetical protein
MLNKGRLEVKNKQIIELLQNYSETCENQAGDKGNVIWEDDFEKVADELMEINKVHEYAKFCVECDRRGLKLLRYEDWETLK